MLPLDDGRAVGGCSRRRARVDDDDGGARVGRPLRSAAKLEIGVDVGANGMASTARWGAVGLLAATARGGAHRARAYDFRAGGADEALSAAVRSLEGYTPSAFACGGDTRKVGRLRSVWRAAAPEAGHGAIAR